MSWLEVKGAEVAIRRAKRFAKTLAATVVVQVNTHTTQKMEQIMSELSRLSEAVERELSDDASQNELIATLKAQLEEAQAAVGEAVEGEQEAVDRLNEALAVASAAADRLESNDPRNPDDEPHPDQTLPGDLPQ